MARTTTRTTLLRCGLILMPLGFVVPGIAAIMGRPVGSMWLTNYSCPFAFVLANAIVLASSRKWILKVFASLAIVSIMVAMFSVNVPGVNYNAMDGPGYFYSMLFVFILLPLSVLLSLIVFVLGVLEVRRDPPPEGHCTSCGYDLRGLREPRCPECGTPFDPKENIVENSTAPEDRMQAGGGSA